MKATVKQMTSAVLQHKADNVYDILVGEPWFDNLSMDEQGFVCVDIAKHLNMKSSTMRLVVFDAAKTYGKLK